MEIRLLEYFLAVSEELHFTKAAEKLNISQPTLSHQIRLLEDRVGSNLFQRIGRKIHLTEAGQLLLEHSQRVFYELDQVKIKIDELKGLQRGKLTIGCSGNHLLHSSIISFHKQYPKIQLSVIDTNTEDTTKKILNNKFDIGVVFLPVDSNQFETIRLFTTEIVVVVSKDHKLATKAFIQLEELQSTPLFLLQKKFFLRQDIDSYCKEVGIQLNPVVELSDFHSLLQMTILNNGATILPSIFLESVNDNRIQPIKIIDQIPKKEVGIVFRKNSSMPLTVKTFVNHLIENYKTIKNENKET